MSYSLEISEAVNKVFKKLEKRDKKALVSINKKVDEILKNPYHYKPLRAPMQNKRRVHIRSFVLMSKTIHHRWVACLFSLTRPGGF